MKLWEKRRKVERVGMSSVGGESLFEQTEIPEQGFLPPLYRIFEPQYF